MNDARDPLRRIAQERGRMLGELGVRPEDVRWARAEAEAIASAVAPGVTNLPAPLARLWRRWRRLWR